MDGQTLTTLGIVLPLSISIIGSVGGLFLFKASAKEKFDTLKEETSCLKEWKEIHEKDHSKEREEILKELYEIKLKLQENATQNANILAKLTEINLWKRS